MGDVISIDSKALSINSVLDHLTDSKLKIKGLTVVVEWEDGSTSIMHEEKTAEKLCYDAVILNKYAGDFICDLSIED